MSDDLIERYGRWLQNTGYDGGVNSPPVLIYRMVRQQAAEVLTLRAEVERLNKAIKAQSAAVRALAANEETEINRLRKKEAEAYKAIATLDSERAMNALLTEEVEILRAERNAAVQAAELRGVALGIEAAAKWAKNDAKTCDCDAYSESECACGAWCKWKTVPMHRVIEALSALSPAAIIAAHKRAQALSELAAADAVLLDLPEEEV